MLISLPKVMLNRLHFLYGVEIIVFKSFRPLVFHNKISGGLFEAFSDIVEIIGHVGLTSFSAEDAEKIYFLMSIFVITKEQIDNNNYSNKLNSFNKMLEVYRLSCLDVYHDLKNLELCYSASSTDFLLCNTKKRNYLSTSFVWIKYLLVLHGRKEVVSIDIQMNVKFGKCKFGRDTEKGSETMTDSLDKVKSFLKDMELSTRECREYGCREHRKKLWILVSISTLKNLK